MPDYEYRAKNGPEEIVEGMIEAVSESMAIEKIHRMGYIPIKVRALKVSRSTFALPWVSGVPRRKLVAFSRYLARFLKSGVTIIRALQILHDQESEPRLRQALNNTLAQVQAGKSLSQALAAYPKIFSPVYLAMAQSGEAGGKLPEALTQMASYLAKEEAIATKVRQALAYPVLLALAGLATLTYILTSVVPKLQAVFVTLNQELPFSTKLVIQISEFMHTNALSIMIVLIVALLAMREFLRRETGSRVWDQCLIAIPLIGNFIFKASFARFSRTMQMSLTSGLTFLDSIKLAIPTIENTLIKDGLQRCYERVRKGEKLGRCLRQMQMVPVFVSDLVVVGEEAGRVDDVFMDIAETYESDIDELVHLFTSLLEPMMILMIGSAVGFIVIAMLLPIFDINVMANM